MKVFALQCLYESYKFVQKIKQNKQNVSVIRGQNKPSEPPTFTLYLNLCSLKQWVVSPGLLNSVLPSPAAFITFHFLGAGRAKQVLMTKWGCQHSWAIFEGFEEAAHTLQLWLHGYQFPHHSFPPWLPLSRQRSSDSQLPVNALDPHG